MTLLAFFLFVMVPTSCVGWYFFKVATPMYVTETKMAFKKGDKLLNTGTGDFLTAIMGSSSLAAQDALIVVAYLKSPEALRDADAALDLRGHYSNREADYLSRLPETPTQDQFYRYWQGIVYAKIDTEFGLLNLSIKAFSPEMARELSLHLYAKCEALINQLNDRMLVDSLDLATSEVAGALRKVADSQRELEAFRKENNVLDLESSAGVSMRVIGDLESEIARTNAEIEAKRPFLGENHAEMRTLRSRLSALREQVDTERRKVAGDMENQKSIASIAAEYERRVTDLAFARKQHEMAMEALENARIQAKTKTTYIIPVVNPALPDEALHPKAAQSTGLFFLVNVLVFGFFSMLYAALKDHLGI